MIALNTLWLFDEMNTAEFITDVCVVILKYAINVMSVSRAQYELYKHHSGWFKVYYCLHIS